MICSSVKRFFICKFSMVEITTRTHSQTGYTFEPQVSWLCFLAWRIGADLSSLRKLLAQVQSPPPLSAWTSFGLAVGSKIWVVPAAGAASVAILSSNRWGLAARCVVLCGLAVAAWVLFMVLNVGIYSPVEWFMNKVL